MENLEEIIKVYAICPDENTEKEEIEAMKDSSFIEICESEGLTWDSLEAYEAFIKKMCLDNWIVRFIKSF